MSQLSRELTCLFANSETLPGMQTWRRHIRRALKFGTAGIAGAAVGPAAAGTGLGALGFSSIGPVAGSYAAGVMSAAGTIKAGELQVVEVTGLSRRPCWPQCMCKGGIHALGHSSSDMALFCRQLVCLCTICSNGRHDAVHCTGDSRHSWHWAGRLLAAQAHMHRSQQGVQQVSLEISYRVYHPATKRHVKYEQAASVAAWKMPSE